MNIQTISTKEIRNDLEGFLRRLRQGQVLQVLYRSKPLVTLAAQDTIDPYLAADAGSPSAGQRSARRIRGLPPRPTTFDSRKSFKALYDETRPL